MTLARSLPAIPAMRWHALMFVAGAFVLVAVWMLMPADPSTDTTDYYLLDLARPYANDWGATHAFVYSPAYALALDPLTNLPFELFFRVILGVNLLALAWLVGPAWAAVALLLPPLQEELSNSQIHILIASSVVLMVKYPGWWAFTLLSKVTPGVTILWFVARREWRHLGIAVALTAVIVAGSALLMPQAWADWIALLTTSSTRTISNFALNEWPAVFRLPIAAGLTIMAGWRNRPAALPVIACFALPAIWVGALSMLLAVPRLRRALDAGVVGRVAGVGPGHPDDGQLRGGVDDGSRSDVLGR